MKKEYWLIVILTSIIVLLSAVIFFVPKKVVQDKIKPGLTIISTERKDANNFANIKITGFVNGDGWVPFEGQAGVAKLLDKNNESLGYAILAIKGDWMANPPLAFEANVAIPTWQADAIVNLEFTNENPSGDPTKSKKFVMPFDKNSRETMNIKIFFGNLALSASSETDECKRVYQVNRVVPKTQAVARVALEELLKGPTQEEKVGGYFSAFPVGSKLNSIKIENGSAQADFNSATESGGGSCSMAARVAQITQTLMQFDSVKSVIISINGRTGDIFQP